MSDEQTQATTRIDVAEVLKTAEENAQKKDEDTKERPALKGFTHTPKPPKAKPAE